MWKLSLSDIFNSFVICDSSSIFIFSFSFIIYLLSKLYTKVFLCQMNIYIRIKLYVKNNNYREE